MQTRWFWTVATLGVYVTLLVKTPWIGEPLAGGKFSLWPYVAGYFVFGGLLLGAVARWWRDGLPAMWRPLMLSVGSLAAVLEIWWHAEGRFDGVLFDRWVEAMLGLVAVALLVRLLPVRILQAWLGLERRQHHEENKIS